MNANNKASSRNNKFWWLRDVRYFEEIDTFEVEFEDGVTTIEGHDDIRENNGIEANATIQRIKIGSKIQHLFFVHYDNGQTAEVELRRNIPLELPSYFAIAGHQCVVRDHTLIIDDITHQIPTQDNEEAEFCSWLNDTIFPNWIREANGDQQIIAGIHQFAERIEAIWEVVAPPRPSRTNPT